MEILSLKNLKLKAQNNEIKKDNYIILLTSTNEKLKAIKHKIILYINDNHHDFNIKHAKKILKFTKKIKKWDKLIISCDCGISRSSAICASLLLYKYNNDMEIWKNANYTPNAYIYKTMLQEMKINISEKELNKKIKTNINALKKAIKR